MTATKFFLTSRTMYSAIKMGYLWKPCKHLTSLLLYQKDFVLGNKDGILVMLILLIDNATDGMWKIGGAGKYSLNQDHREEFVARGDTWSADYSMNEE
ncbi:sister chromatid cohesion protein [Salix suchowensis]|nr:sister chromatid cohesion protein [Salix suchowensis]